MRKYSEILRIISMEGDKVIILRIKYIYWLTNSTTFQVDDVYADNLRDEASKLGLMKLINQVMTKGP